MPSAILAQNAATSLPTILAWIGGLIAAIVMLTLVIVAVRRNYMADDDAPITTGSMLEQLRTMRDQGKLSEVEFQTARSRLSAKVRASAGLDGPAGARSENPPRQPTRQPQLQSPRQPPLQVERQRPPRPARPDQPPARQAASSPPPLPPTPTPPLPPQPSPQPPRKFPPGLPPSSNSGPG